MQEIERKLSSRHLPTDCQKDEKLFRATLLKAASHHIPTGRRKLYTQQVPAEILAMMEERDDLRKQDPASPRLSTMNDEITKATSDHKRRQWREFVESIDHRNFLECSTMFFYKSFSDLNLKMHPFSHTQDKIIRGRKKKEITENLQK